MSHQGGIPPCLQHGPRFSPIRFGWSTAIGPDGDQWRVVTWVQCSRVDRTLMRAGHCRRPLTGCRSAPRQWSGAADRDDGHSRSSPPCTPCATRCANCWRSRRTPTPGRGGRPGAGGRTRPVPGLRRALGSAQPRRRPGTARRAGRSPDRATRAAATPSGPCGFPQRSRLPRGHGARGVRRRDRDGRAGADPAPPGARAAGPGRAGGHRARGAARVSRRGRRRPRPGGPPARPAGHGCRDRGPRRPGVPRPGARWRMGQPA